MATNVGLKLGIDGEAKYRSELNNIIAQAKSLDSEMKAVTSAFTANTSAEERNAKTNAVLTKQIDVQKQKLEAQQQMLDKAVQKYGEADTRTLTWKDAVNQTTATLNNMQNRLKGVNTDLDKTGQELGEGKEKGLSFGDILKANITSDAIISGVKALAGAVKQVAQEIVNAAKESMKWGDDLNTLSEQTGLTTDQLQELQYMSAFIDVDVNTVTGSLRKLTMQMDNAKGGTGAAAEAFAALGVAVTDENGQLRDNYDVFLDTIDALGTIDNQTQRDALAMDIFGRSATELNTMIAAGSDEMRAYAQEAHDVGAVLSNDMVQDLAAAQDAADTVTNKFNAMKNGIVAQFAPAISEALGGFVDVLAGSKPLEEFIGDMMEHLPEIIEMGVNLLTSLVNGVVKALPVVIPAIIRAGVQLFVSLVAALPEIITNIIAVIPDIITGVITAITESLPLIIQAGVDLFVALVQALPEIIAGIVAALPQIIDAVITALTSVAPLLINAGVDLFLALIQNMPAIIAGIIKAVPKIITALVNGLKNGMKAIANVGLELVRGLWRGISNSFEWIKQKISEWVGNVLSFIKKLFGISSPSKVTTWYGEMLTAGLAKGITDGRVGINSAWRAATGGIGGITANVAGNIAAMSGRAGMVVTFNIQQLPGEDSNALAQRINRQLGRLYA